MKELIKIVNIFEEMKITNSSKMMGFFNSVRGMAEYNARTGAKDVGLEWERDILVIHAMLHSTRNTGDLNVYCHSVGESSISVLCCSLQINCWNVNIFSHMTMPMILHSSYRT